MARPLFFPSFFVFAFPFVFLSPLLLLLKIYSFCNQGGAVKARKNTIKTAKWRRKRKILARRGGQGGAVGFFAVFERCLAGVGEYVKIYTLY